MEKKAEELYNKLLQIVKKDLGNKTTFSNELQKVGVKYLRTKFKGVFASDKIPVLNDLKSYAILNLDISYLLKERAPPETIIFLFFK